MSLHKAFAHESIYQEYVERRDQMLKLDLTIVESKRQLGVLFWSRDAFARSTIITKVGRTLHHQTREQIRSKYRATIPEDFYEEAIKIIVEQATELCAHVIAQETSGLEISDDLYIEYAQTTGVLHLIDPALKSQIPGFRQANLITMKSSLKRLRDRGSQDDEGG